jgi:hypothetical protein
VSYKRLVDPNLAMVSDGPQPTAEERWTARAGMPRAEERLAAAQVEAIQADRRDAEARAELSAAIISEFDDRLQPAYTKAVRCLRAAAAALRAAAEEEAAERDMLAAAGATCPRETFSNAWGPLKSGLVEHWAETLRGYGLIGDDD